MSNAERKYTKSMLDYIRARDRRAWRVFCVVMWSLAGWLAWCALSSDPEPAAFVIVVVAFQFIVAAALSLADFLGRLHNK